MYLVDLITFVSMIKIPRAIHVGLVLLFVGRERLNSHTVVHSCRFTIQYCDRSVLDAIHV